MLVMKIQVVKLLAFLTNLSEDAQRNKCLN